MNQGEMRIDLDDEFDGRVRRDYDRDQLKNVLSAVFSAESKLIIERELLQSYERLARQLGYAPSKKEVNENHELSIQLKLKEDPDFIGPTRDTSQHTNDACYSWDVYKQYFGTMKELRQRAGVPVDRKTAYPPTRALVVQPEPEDKSITSSGNELLESLETSVKYFDHIDEFIKVRNWTGGDIGEVLEPFSNKVEYQEALVELLVEDIDRVYSIVDELYGETEFDEVVDLIYQIVIEVNPDLEVGQVTLSTAGVASPEAEVDQDEGVFTSSFTDIRYADAFEQRARSEIVGQSDALSAVSERLTSVCGLRDPNRPVASFMFIGPSGVGKTETAKILSRIYLESEQNFLKIDCGEYQLGHEYQKLIGSPPGYIGHNDGGMLTSWLKEHGRGVILFDEVEKGHPKLHNFLLNLLEEGVVSDNKGMPLNFRDSIVICTSNVGLRDVEKLKSGMGFGGYELHQRGIHDAFIEAASREFKTEFLNRFDDLVAFDYISEEDARQIARLKLKECEEIGKRQGRNIEVHSDLSEWMLGQEFVDRKDGQRKKVYSVNSGARHIKKYARSLVGQLVAREIRKRKIDPELIPESLFSIGVHRDKPVVRVTPYGSAA